MITKFTNFQKYNIINETNSKGNFINTYWITRFVKNPPNRDKKFIEFSNNKELIKKEIELLENYLCIDQQSNIDKVDYDKLVYTLKIFIKTRIWNKVVSILYGENYRSNPLSDSGKITTLRQGLAPDVIETTFGEVFSKLWEDIDQYCDNATEFVSTGELDDSLESSIVIIGEITRDYLITAIACMLISLLIEFPPAAMASASAYSELTIITTKYLDRFSKFYDKINKITPAIVNTYKKLSTYGDKIWTAYGIGELTKLVIGVLIEEPEIKALGFKNIEEKIIEGHEDKQKFISRVKNKLENHTDFKKSWIWNIDSKYYKNLERMPNWKNWIKSNEGKTKSSEQFGYILTYYISLYCWQFQKYVIYYSWLKNLDKNFDEVKKLKNQKAEPIIDIRTIKTKVPASDATSVSRQKF